jgi:prevent-host-death family protein
MTTATIFEAKTKLSELLQKAQKGESVVITSGREKTPVARLGALETSGFTLTPEFFEPLAEDELRLWNEGA